MNILKRERKKSNGKSNIVKNAIRLLIWCMFAIIILLLEVYITVGIIPIMADFIAQTNLRFAINQASVNKFWIFVAFAGYILPCLFGAALVYTLNYKLVKKLYSFTKKLERRFLNDIVRNKSQR